MTTKTTEDELKKVDEYLSSRSKVQGILSDKVESIIKTNSLVSDKTLFVGDMHLEYNFTGAHIDYARNCRRVMKQILDHIKSSDINCVVFLGDLIGVKIGVGYIKNRDFLSEVMDFFLDIIELGCVPIVLRGNHDLYEPSDFTFLSKYGFFIDPASFNYRLDIIPSEGSPDITFELLFVPYGREQEDLDLKPSDNKSRVVLAHNNFYVGTKAEFYVTDKAIDVSSHLPFYNADVILTGDIHVPSSNILDFKYGNGEDGLFLNLGCPTRPQKKPRYDFVWFFELLYNNENGVVEPSISNIAIKLPDYDDTFVETADVDSILKEETDVLEERKQALESVLQSIGTIETENKDYNRVIDSMDFISNDVRSLAKSYLQRAIAE